MFVGKWFVILLDYGYSKIECVKIFKKINWISVMRLGVFIVWVWFVCLSVFFYLGIIVFFLFEVVLLKI